MKYILTKEGIYEIENSYEHLGKTYYGIKGRISTFAEEEVIDQSDTIEELCDAFVYRKCDYMTLDEAIHEKEWEESDLQQDCYPIYGAIWAKGEHDEPILKSVAKMNDKGEFELL